MKFINTLWICLTITTGSCIFAMDEDDRFSFRCKVPVEREERSLPAGTDLSVNAVSVGVFPLNGDQKIRAEKLAEIEALSNVKTPWNYISQWDYQKKILKDVLENYGIHPNEIVTWDPLFTSFMENDDKFAFYLIKKGADVNKRVIRENSVGARPIEYVQSLPIAKLMIQKGAKLETISGLIPSLKFQPKLALFYYKYGGNVVNPDCAKDTGLLWLLQTIPYFCDSTHTQEWDRCIHLAKFLVDLGVSLDVRIPDGEENAGCDYQELLEKMDDEGEFFEQDREKLSLAIDEAIQKKVAAQAQGMPIVTKELAYHFRSGPRQIEDIVKAYLGELISDDVLRQMDEVDREADLMLSQLKAPEQSNCAVM